MPDKTITATESPQETPSAPLAFFLSACRDLLRAAGVKPSIEGIVRLARATGRKFDDKAARAIIRSWGTAVPPQGQKPGQKPGGTGVAPGKNPVNEHEKRGATAPAPGQSAPTRVHVARGVRTNSLRDHEDLLPEASANSVTPSLADRSDRFANAQRSSELRLLDFGQAAERKRRDRRLPGTAVPPAPENVAAGQLLEAIWARLRPEHRPRGMTQTRWRGINIRFAKDLLASGLSAEQALEGFDRHEREHHGEQLYTVARLQSAIAQQAADDRRRGVDGERPFGTSLYTDEELAAMP